MNDKTNEEKLRILQERLANIQQKKEIHQEEKIQQNKPVAPVFEEELVNIDPIEKTPKQPGKKSGCFKYFIISFILFFIILLVGGGFYAYKSDYFNSLFTSNKPEPEIETEKNITYYKSSFDESGNFIIVLNTFEEKELANAEAQSLTEEGYNCEVLQLSGVSNSKREVYQTYISSGNKEGKPIPFNKENEASHYLKALVSSDGLLEEETDISNVGTVFELQ